MIIIQQKSNIQVISESQVSVIIPFAKNVISYLSEIVSAADYALTDNLTLKHGVISVFDIPLVSTNDFSIVLPTPILGTANECVFIFKVGVSLPAINVPVGIVWRGKSPVPLVINTTYTIAFEQVSYNGTTFEIYGTAIKNV